MTLLLLLVLMFDHHADRNLYQLVLTAPISVPLMIFDHHISTIGLLIVYAAYALTFAATFFLLTGRRRPPPRGFPVNLIESTNPKNRTSPRT